jgi:hypothetical protein
MLQQAAGETTTAIKRKQPIAGDKTAATVITNSHSTIALS